MLLLWKIFSNSCHARRHEKTTCTRNPFRAMKHYDNDHMQFMQGATLKEHIETCKGSSTGSQHAMPPIPLATSMGTVFADDYDEKINAREGISLIDTSVMDLQQGVLAASVAGVIDVISIIWLHYQNWLRSGCCGCCGVLRGSFGVWGGWVLRALRGKFSIVRVGEGNARVDEGNVRECEGVWDGEWCEGGVKGEGVRAALDNEVLRADVCEIRWEWSSTGMQRRAALFGSIPTFENPGLTRPGSDTGSPWWEASSLIAQPLRPHSTGDIQNDLNLLPTDKNPTSLNLDIWVHIQHSLVGLSTFEKLFLPRVTVRLDHNVAVHRPAGKKQRVALLAEELGIAHNIVSRAWMANRPIGIAARELGSDHPRATMATKSRCDIARQQLLLLLPYPTATQAEDGEESYMSSCFTGVTRLPTSKTRQ
ncbi:hypothetical protein PR048_019921 [Dryococelus australis]|uniref:Uncharacterized protein n=1 Tax=Dryococelus australis TaxID=614101 RepID=A0ABQ9H4V2_9NEOP|nr:hypothetical protein PR048_019921 [Dryococelus australis]